MRVRQWMTENPITITPQTSVHNARRVLHAHRMRHLPVVDGDDQVVGMVSDRDLLMSGNQMVQALSSLQSDLLSGFYRSVETIMTVPVQTVGPNEPVSRAAKLMLHKRVSALPVLDKGRLVGIITTSDCFRALLNESDQDRQWGRRLQDHDDHDPDWHKIMPMPPGDDRPGRPSGVQHDPVPAAEPPTRKIAALVG